MNFDKYKISIPLPLPISDEIKCPNCGKINTIKNNFCPRCAHSIFDHVKRMDLKYNEDLKNYMKESQKNNKVFLEDLLDEKGLEKDTPINTTVEKILNYAWMEAHKDGQFSNYRKVVMIFDNIMEDLE